MKETDLATGNEVGLPIGEEPNKPWVIPDDSIIERQDYGGTQLSTQVHHANDPRIVSDPFKGLNPLGRA